ncbi:14291_t:CDS:2 [Funneliformis geosporum]|uniref:14291_t:CDS:1 n=1 Tax=Funneliformis geosporum TaxID=1117311 RepID=A0A9W4SES3_9GLOM|nr:14291_t:CDS:2 [Funneliformis geosporum]
MKAGCRYYTVKALIDTSSRVNSIRRSLVDKLKIEYTKYKEKNRLEYLDLFFQYEGKDRLVSTNSDDVFNDFEVTEKSKVDLKTDSSESKETNGSKYMAVSYPNLRYLNLWDAQITDKCLYAITRSCCKLEYLNIFYCRNISDKSLFEIAGNYHDLQDREDVKDASTLMRRCFNIEYLNFSGVMALWDDRLIIAIIKDLQI